MNHTNQEVLMYADQLYKEFPIRQSLTELAAKKPAMKVVAVDRVSLKVYQKETLGLVGESGCGKSTLGKTMIRLYEPDGGRIFFGGQEITNLSKKELRKKCVEFQMIFQDPYSSLNPRMTVGQIIGEALAAHQKCQKAELMEKAEALLRLVGLTKEQAGRYPGEFSGGQRQRVGIARALSLNPKLIIADEPVSALDVSIQAQILNLLCQLKQELGLTVLFISHDLRVVRYITDRVAVMYLGKIVELADTVELYRNPVHPYTQALMKSNPNLDPRIRKKKAEIEGEPPSPIHLPAGCRFSPRCKFAGKRCFEELPELKEVGQNHYAACFFGAVQKT